MLTSKTLMITQAKRTLDTFPKWTSSTHLVNLMALMKSSDLDLNQLRTGKMPTERKTLNTTWMNLKALFIFPISSVFLSRTTLTLLSCLKLLRECLTILLQQETGKNNKSIRPDSFTKSCQIFSSLIVLKNSETWTNTKTFATLFSKSYRKSPNRLLEYLKKMK